MRALGRTSPLRLSTATMASTERSERIYKLLRSPPKSAFAIPETGAKLCEILETPPANATGEVPPDA